MNLFELDVRGFKDKHIKVEHKDDLVVVSAEKRTVNKKTGVRKLNSFEFVFSDDSVRDKTVRHELKENKLWVTADPS